MALNGYNGNTHGYNTVIATGLSANAEDVKAVIPPIGAIIAWGKRFELLTSGVTTATTAGKLVAGADTFVTDGVAVEHYIVNTTDSTETYCTAVDSEIQLSVNDDIFTHAENYEIYTTPRLPDGWLECNGQAVSDSDSPFNGATMPQLNNTERFLRGMTAVSGTAATTGGADTINIAHQHTIADGGQCHGQVNPNRLSHPGTTGGSLSAAQSILPSYYEVVWIMRVK